MRTCSIENCEGEHVARGLCSKHYHQAKYRGEFEDDLRTRDGNQGCAVEDCDGQHYAKTYCHKHYKAFSKYGTPTPPEKEVTLCECGEKAYGRGMCKNHYMQDYYKRNPDKREAQRQYSRNYVRPDGLPLKPVKEVVGYFQAHRRVKALRGAPSQHTCAACGNRAQEWSLLPGKGELIETIRGFDLPYSLNPDNYTPMCVPCHRAQDNAGRKKSA